MVSGQISGHSVCHGFDKVVKVDDSGSEWLKISESGGKMDKSRLRTKIINSERWRLKQ